MRRAIALAEWFLNEAYRIYAMLAGGEELLDRASEIILAKIRQLGGETTARDLQSKIRLKIMQEYSTSDTLERKLRKMAKAGPLTVRHEKAENGRAVEYFGIPTTIDEM